MTTLLAAPAVTADLDDALHELAAAAALLPDDERIRDDLASVVAQVERLAGAALEDVGADPLVVLQRRLGRAARHLRAATVDDVEHVRNLARALQPGRPGTITAAPGRAVRTAALAPC